jgi:hypothetical protein
VRAPNVIAGIQSAMRSVQPEDTKKIGCAKYIIAKTLAR